MGQRSTKSRKGAAMTEPAPRTDFIYLLAKRFVAAADEYIGLRRQVALLKADVAFRAKHIQIMKKFLEQHAEKRGKSNA
jgi:VIT1/CCC1 family predicted Fe2+/Mn2+ transporter